MSFSTQSSLYFLKLSDLPLTRLNQVKLPYVDAKGNDIKSSWKDYLNLSVDFSASALIVREFDIKIGVSHSIIKDIDRTPFIVKVGVDTERINNAGQVIGDIRFYDKVLNETDYDATITPFGYGKWRELVTGDYIYEKALCKYSMQASLNADRPNTRTYIHKVDVPDVVDRGIATLTKSNQPLFVRFSDEEVRKFHIVPELTVSIKSYSGTGNTPLVIPYNTTTEGFYVTMKADGAFVEGSISWSARGY